MSVLIRDSLPTDVPAIAAIYGHAVLHGNASFELDPPDAAEIARRRAALLAAGFPYLVAEDAAGRVVGYSHGGAYRTRPGYRFTVENSVYVAPDSPGTRVRPRPVAAADRTLRARGLPADGRSDRRFGQPGLGPTARRLRLPPRGIAAGHWVEAWQMAGLGPDGPTSRPGSERTAAPGPLGSCRFGQLPVDRQAVPARGDGHRVALLHRPFQDQRRQRVLQAALDHPLQRPRAVGAVVALVRQPFERTAVQLEPDLAIGQQLAQVVQLDLHDRSPCRCAAAGGTG